MDDGQKAPRRRLRLATGAVAALAALAVPSGALAKSAPLAGDLMGGPETKRAKVVVPVLVSKKTQRKLKLRDPLAKLKLKRSMDVKTRKSGVISPSRLRDGDAVKGRAKLKKGKKQKVAKRAKLGLPVVKVKKLKVLGRESVFTNDELAGLVFALAGQLSSLSGRVDELSLSTAAGFADLQGQIDALESRVAALESALAGLEDALGALDAKLTAAIDGLGDDLDELRDELTALQGQVQDLLTRVADLEDAVEQLDALVDALTTRVDALEVAVDDLTAQVDAINDALGRLVAGLGADDLPDAIQQIVDLFGTVGDLSADLLALEGRIGDVEDRLDQLELDLAALDADLQGQIDQLEADLAALDADLQGQIDQLEADLAALDAELDTVQTDLQNQINALEADLQAQIDDLDADISALTADLQGLCDVTSPVLVLLQASGFCP